MGTPADPQQVIITNERGGKVGVQAGHFIVHGDNIVQSRHDQDPLKLLPYAPNASFNASGKEDDPFCLSGTRVGVLDYIRAWIDREDKRHIFWLSGWAGTGKSTIARTVAREHYDRKRLVTSYFFAKDGGDTSRATKFVGTIAAQIAHKSPEFKNLLQNAVSQDQGIVQRVLRDQWRELIIAPLSQLGDDSLPSPIIVVVDALDECENESDIRHVLQLLANTGNLNRHHFRVLITSRPEAPIRDTFSGLSDREYLGFVLHDISKDIVDDDILLFLKQNLAMIRPEEQVTAQLVQKAAGLFIWAATACRFIHEGKKRWAIKNRLSTILQSSRSITAPDQHLNEIYITVLRHSIPAVFSAEDKEKLCGKLRRVLGSLVVLSSPLSAYSLSSLLHIPREDVDESLEDLHAILDIPENQTLPLRLHHPSFRDFLLDKDICSDLNFWIDEREMHERLANKCLQLISSPKDLKQDMCNLTRPGTLRSEIDSRTIDDGLPPEMRYACRYWVHHLEQSKGRICDGDSIHTFL